MKRIRRYLVTSKYRVPRGTRSLEKRLARVAKLHVRALHKLIESQVMPILDTDQPNKADAISRTLESIRDYIVGQITTAARPMLMQVHRIITEKVDKQFELGYKFTIPHSSARTRDLIESLLIESLELIKSIPQDLIESAHSTLLPAVGAFDKQSVINALHNAADVSSRRAEFIARDQVAKATERYSQARATDLGFEYYIWQTSQDSRVSTGEGGHKVLNQRLYRYDTPTAVIDTYRTLGIPSQRPNCRCNSLPYLPLPNEVVTKRRDPKHGDYYIVTRTKRPQP